MDIRVFDQSLTMIGILDVYAACIYRSCFSDYGTFEIYTDVTAKGLLKMEDYIMVDGDGRKSGRIEYMSCSDTEEGQMVIKGYTLAFLLSQRLTVPPAGHAYHAIKAPAEDIIYALVRANASDAADPARNFRDFVLGESMGRGQTLYYQTRYDNLIDAIKEIAEASGLGFGIRLDQSLKKLVFEVYSGRDLSGSQPGISPYVFDMERENIYTRDYTDDMLRYKNCAYTGGQGDGENRAIYIAGAEHRGMERRELFVDARDLSDPANLPDRAAVKLAELERKQSYQSEVLADEYETKWRLGDIVVTRDREYGVFFTERVTAVEESWDDTGKSVIPTFGTTEKTLAQMAQSKENGGLLVEGIKGDIGKTGERGEQGYSLQYQWNGTKLGVKREDETSYQYQNLQGPRGEAGSSGGIIISKIEPLNPKDGQVWI